MQHSNASQRIEIDLPEYVVYQLDTIVNQYALTRNAVIRQLIEDHPFQIPAGGESRKRVTTGLALSQIYRTAAAERRSPPEITMERKSSAILEVKHRIGWPVREIKQRFGLRLRVLPRLRPLTPFNGVRK
ncbi:hypothetical protein ACS8YF_00350 [Salinisphaera sp. SWV1]|uniref:hypothetical protein n=1 Tax=Salinisphaera sp. SWV1 TaxID=3454139 RepID=UPI003F84E110